MSYITLPSTVPTLDKEGQNWALFKSSFSEAVKDIGDPYIWGHFSGADPRPIPANEKNPTDDEKAAMEAWDEVETTADQILADHLDFDVYTKLESESYIAGKWAALRRWRERV